MPAKKHPSKPDSDELEDTTLGEPVSDKVSAIDREFKKLYEHTYQYPEEFSRMPDDVLFIAAQSYVADMEAGRKREDAIADAIGAAKAYAKANGVPYRKG